MHSKDHILFGLGLFFFFKGTLKWKMLQKKIEIMIKWLTQCTSLWDLSLSSKCHCVKWVKRCLQKWSVENIKCSYKFCLRCLYVVLPKVFPKLYKTDAAFWWCKYSNIMFIVISDAKIYWYFQSLHLTAAEICAILLSTKNRNVFVQKEFNTVHLYLAQY